jgi:DNA invertase Pin-like site-specific DNA recombinase
MKRLSTRVLAYCRVSTEEQSISGLGLADQRAAIEREGARRSWSEIEYLTDEGFSAKSLARPAIRQALEELEDGRASVLVVSKLDRLSRSLLDFASLMDQAKRQGWQLVVLDLAIDTTTPSGSLMANVMASFAEYERQLIGQRTSAALQQKKTQGFRLGRPVTLDRSIAQRIDQMRRDGASTPFIASTLNTEAVPTARGGKQWYPSTVSAVLRSLSLDKNALA